jgi:hypothetical protein
MVRDRVVLLSSVAFYLLVGEEVRAKNSSSADKARRFCWSSNNFEGNGITNSVSKLAKEVIDPCTHRSGWRWPHGPWEEDKAGRPAVVRLRREDGEG